MTRKHLFLMDPLPHQVDPEHDTTYLLIKETAGRGIESWVAPACQLSLQQAGLKIAARRVEMDSGGDADRVEYSEEELLNADQFDLIWLREDPPFNRDYLYTTYLLEKTTTPVVNHPAGVRDSNEKLLIFEFPELIPQSWVGANFKRALEFIRAVNGRAVLKSLSGFGGEEVYLLELKKAGLEELFNRETVNGTRPVMLQEFLEAVCEQGDRRVLLLDGEPLGGLTRHPAAGDFRANLHSGGRSGEAYLTDQEKHVCRQLKPVLQKRGLFFVGLDMIGDKITEINVTSPTCLQEINRATGSSLEKQVIDQAEQLSMLNF